MRILLGLIKKKEENKIEKSNAELLQFDWFFDKVKFRRQSKLAMVLGILTIISSFSVFSTLGSSLGSGMWFFIFIVWILIVLSGIALLSLGARKVPDYHSLADSIEDYVKEEIRKSHNAIIKESKNREEPEVLHGDNPV